MCCVEVNQDFGSDIGTDRILLSYLSEPSPSHPHLFYRFALQRSQMELSADILSSLLAHLPGELQLAILQTAAEHFVQSDRRTVISIAQSSKMLYALAAPILYFVIVLHDSNQRVIQQLLDNPAAARHIRSILAINHNWRPTTEQCMQLTGVRVFSGLYESIIGIYARLPSTTQRSIKTFLSWNTDMPSHNSLHTMMQSITHIGLYVSYDSPPFLTSVQGWLDAMPLVDRLSLEAITLVSRGEHATRPSVFASELGEILKRLQNHRVKHVYIRLASNAPATGPEFRNALATIYPVPPQIWLWQDERGITDHFVDERVCIKDTLAGRYAFTVGSPVLPLR